MNRREMITGAAATVATVAKDSTAQYNDPAAPSKLPKEVLDKEYSTCQLRGHVPEVNNNFYITSGVVIPAPTLIFQPHPEQRYIKESATDWVTCWYCRRKYRFITKMEESE